MKRVNWSNFESNAKALTRNVKNLKVVQAQGEEDYKIQIEVEDEVKARLKITKLEQGTTTTINQIK